MARRRKNKTLLGGLFGLLFKKTSPKRAPKRPPPKPQRSPAEENAALARRIRAGEIKGEALADLFRSGKIRTGRRNPTALTAAEKRELEAARRLSREFHGSAEIVELDPAERKLSRFAVIAGNLDDFTYSPPARSKRGAYNYQHEVGDRGPGEPRAANKPLLVVDPKTKRAAVVAHRSPMRFNAKKGFIG